MMNVSVYSTCTSGNSKLVNWLLYLLHSISELILQIGHFELQLIVFYSNLLLTIGHLFLYRIQEA